MSFKVGDKVKYTGRYSGFIARDAIGIITHKEEDGWEVLFSDNIKWFCMEGNLIKLPSKNQQLVFDFMEK